VDAGSRACVEVTRPRPRERACQPGLASRRDRTSSIAPVPASGAASGESERATNSAISSIAARTTWANTSTRSSPRPPWSAMAARAALIRPRPWRSPRARLEQDVLALEVVIERAAADAGFLQDGFDRRRLVPALGEQRGGHREQVLAGRRSAGDVLVHPVR